MPVLKRTQKLYVAPTALASGSAIGSATFRTPFVDTDLNSSFDTADRNVIINSIVKEFPFTVRETLGGSITKELYFQTAGAVSSLAGTRIPDHYLLVAAGLNGGNGGEGGAASAGVTSAYRYTNTASAPALASKWLNVYRYLDNEQPSTGSGEIYQHTSGIVTGVTWNFAVGSVVEPQWTFGGLTTKVTSAVATPTDSAPSYEPAIPKLMTITIGGTSFSLTDLTINIAGDSQNVESIETTGLTDILATGYSFNGSFSVLYSTADAFYKKFINSTTAAITAKIGDANAQSGTSGYTITFNLPYIKFTNVTPSLDNEFMVNQVDFTAANPAGQSSGALEIVYEWITL